MITSSSDVRLSTKNETRMINKLNHMNKNFIVSDSDSGKEFEKGSCFLKGGAFAVLWNIIVNHVNSECMHDQEHGWCNTVILKVNRK